MLLHISSDGAPIYQQIVDQIQYRIISGQLRGGDELPTIRGLAENLHVNPNTVARAYRELEHSGLVEKRRTTGTFVTDLTQRLTAVQRRRVLAPPIDKLIHQARHLGIGIEELVEQIRKRNNQISSRETSA
jgi:GntR family transcriptional regulator